MNRLGLCCEYVSRQVKRLREFAYVAASNEAEGIVVDGVRHVKSQFAKSPTDARSSSTSGGITYCPECLWLSRSLLMCNRLF